MKTIYLAGPMSGYPEDNHPRFNELAKLLREDGHFVFNPAEVTPYGPSRTYRNCLAVDLAWICAHADTMYFMEGWENSKGAQVEHALAVALKLEIVYL